MAFQLVDDLLGIWGDPRATGKPTGSDLAARKKSLPVTAALVSETLPGRSPRATCALSRTSSREGIIDAVGAWGRGGTA